MSVKELQRHHLQEGVAHMQILVGCLNMMKQAPQPQPQGHLTLPKSLDSGYDSIAVADGDKRLQDVEEADGPDVVQPPNTSAQKLPQTLGEFQAYKDIISQLADQNLLLLVYL